MMTKPALLLPIVFASLLHACALRVPPEREGKDVYLEANNSSRIGGAYRNVPTVKEGYMPALYYHFREDSPYVSKDITIKIIPQGEKRLRIIAMADNRALDSILIRGKYMQGYFKQRAQFQMGCFDRTCPLFWGIGGGSRGIGLSKEGNVVVFTSNGFGLLMLLAVPIFAGGGNDDLFEYARQEHL